MGQTEQGEAQVLLVAAKREMVEQFLSVVRAVGMRTGVVECGAFSIANMFEYNYGLFDGLTALVNVGASVTQVSLLAAGQYVFTRDVPIGGEEYSRRIMETLSVDRDNAENLKIASSQGDGGGSPELAKLLAEINEQLVSEIQVTIDFFFQSGDPSAAQGGIGNLFLTGGGSRVLGLDAALAAALQIPVQILNPFQRIEVNPRKFQMDYISMQGHLYGVAVGLGMRMLGDAG
jgi:type IV pilus assembly protein PilM